jgi:GNAT superfamily N-acetyltransferase
MQIRPFNGDYQLLADLWNASFCDAEGKPVLPFSADFFAQEDAELDARCKVGRLLAEQEGKFVGVADYYQEASRYHPQKFHADVFVHPQAQRQGIGAKLYQHLLTELAPYKPISLRAALREDMLAGLAFMRKHGWREEARIWESFLDLNKMDPSADAVTQRALADKDMAIKTYLELAADPKRSQKLYDLMWQCRQDMPELDEATHEDLETFIAKRVEHPTHLLEAFYIVVKDGDYIALSYYRNDDTNPKLIKTGLTGVARNYRKQGLAYALKLHGLVEAKARGYQTVRTVNESSNRAMLAINERLGFEKRPAWLDCIKTFGENHEDSTL